MAHELQILRGFPDVGRALFPFVLKGVFMHLGGLLGVHRFSVVFCKSVVQTANEGKRKHRGSLLRDVSSLHQKVPLKQVFGSSASSSTTPVKPHKSYSLEGKPYQGCPYLLYISKTRETSSAAHVTVIGILHVNGPMEQIGSFIGIIQSSRLRG